MKLVRKTILYALAVLLLAMLFRGIKPKAISFSVTDDIKVLGARVRKDSVNYISFAVDFSKYANDDNVYLYAIEVSLELSSGYTDDGIVREDIFENVQTQTVEFFTVDEINDGLLYVTINNIPKYKYDTYIYVLGYVEFNDDSVIYSSHYMRRNFTDTARMAYSYGEVGPMIGLAVDGKFVKTVTYDNGAEKVSYSNDIPSDLDKDAVIEFAKGTYLNNIAFNYKVKISGINDVIIDGTLTFNKDLELDNIIVSDKGNIVIGDDLEKISITNSRLTLTSGINIKSSKIKTIVISNNIISLGKAINLNVNKEVALDNNTIYIPNTTGYILVNEGTNKITLTNFKVINSKSQEEIANYLGMLSGNIEIK